MLLRPPISTSFPYTTLFRSESQILKLLRRDRLVAGPNVRLRILKGGISSEVVLIENGGKCFVVKRALPQLRTKDLWRADTARSEEHTSELQSHHDLVCRLLL